jgi:anti-sigma factor RsiW
MWERWKMAGGASAAAGDEALTLPDELTLAAFAEGQLPAAEREAVERLLALLPELAEDIAFARAAPPAEAAGLETIVARACALVPAGGDRVIPLRRSAAAAPRWQLAARWGALAASVALVSYLGFALGSNTSSTLAFIGSSSPATIGDELLDPPSGLFGIGDTGST